MLVICAVLVPYVSSQKGESIIVGHTNSYGMFKTNNKSLNLTRALQSQMMWSISLYTGTHTTYVNSLEAFGGT